MKRAINIKMIIMAVIFLTLCIVFPIWQSSVSANLMYQIACVDSSISSLDRQTSQVKTEITAMTNPEYVRQMAMSFEKSSKLATSI